MLIALGFEYTDCTSKIGAITEIFPLPREGERAEKLRFSRISFG